MSSFVCRWLYDMLYCTYYGHYCQYPCNKRDICENCRYLTYPPATYPCENCETLADYMRRKEGYNDT